MNPPKWQACRTTEANFSAQEYPLIGQQSKSTSGNPRNAWEEQTQVFTKSNESTLLESSTPLDVQRLLDAIKISNEKSVTLSAEAMASATGVAHALGTVTTRMENVEITIEKINNNAKETTKILEAHSALFNTMLEKLNLFTENLHIPPSPTTAQEFFSTTPDPRTPHALSKSQQKSQSMELD